MSTRILFVDDESKVLEALQRSLRPMRREWDMAFANGGCQALEMLSQQPFDVIVTDMRMPGMDGAALLAEVAARYPQVLRIVLSGQSDMESVLQLTGVTHQYLSKPCEAAAVKDAVARALAIRDLVKNDAVRTIVGSMRSIPSVPPVYAALMQVVQSPGASIDKVGQIIAQDMGMTAKVLQLVNSAFFGVNRRMSDPIEATVYLGLNTIRALLLSVHVFSQFEHCRVPGFSIHALWRHSLATSALAERIANSVSMSPLATSGDARVAGLLHDVGKLLLAGNLAEEYDRALRMTAEEQISECDAEVRVFGADHGQIGAYLLGLWSLPDPIIEAVAYHHAPRACVSHAFTALTAVHLADRLQQETMTEFHSVASLDSDYLNQLRIADRLPGWRELSRTLVAEASRHD